MELVDCQPSSKLSERARQLTSSSGFLTHVCGTCTCPQEHILTVYCIEIYTFTFTHIPKKKCVLHKMVADVSYEMSHFNL